MKGSRAAIVSARRRSTGATSGAFRANFLLNDGQSASSTAVSGTVPGTAQAGDVALVEIETANDSVTVTAAPSGWTLLSGPHSDTVGNSWLYGKQLAAGDVGAVASWTLSTSARCAGHGAVYSSVSWTGRTVARLTQTALTLSITIPTVTSVAAGSVVHVGFTRVRGSNPTDVTLPGGYSQGANERSTTAYPSGTSVAAEAAYRLAASAGSYGGETATGNLQSRGTAYTVALPPA